jgi:hypothetical protein
MRLGVDDRTTLRRLAGLVGLEATSTIQLKDVPDVRSPPFLLCALFCRRNESREQAGPSEIEWGKKWTELIPAQIPLVFIYRFRAW